MANAHLATAHQKVLAYLENMGGKLGLSEPERKALSAHYTGEMKQHGDFHLHPKHEVKVGPIQLHKGGFSRWEPVRILLPGHPTTWIWTIDRAKEQAEKEGQTEEVSEQGLIARAALTWYATIPEK